MMPSRITLQVDFIKQGKKFVAYSPALDLSTSGKNMSEVQKRFNEVVEIFFEELIENGTLEEVLTDLGWEKLEKKWNPPQVVSQKPFDISIPIAV